MQSIAESDIIVYPSLYLEPFGRVPIEGMSLGKIVIVSGYGGLEEIIENNFDGFIVDPNNTFEFYSCISNLIDNYEFTKQIKENAIKNVKNKFSLERLYKDYSKLFEELDSF
tara:strand:- start:639 stop:974 length:336 start_codon:yes stop_codon:yes gene_type:complete